MADIDIRRAHSLGMAGARKAADQMAEKLGRKFDLRGDWDGDVLRFERPGVTGTLTVSPKDLHLSVALGFLLRAMKSSIEAAVRQELDAVLAAPPSHGERDKAAEKPARKAPTPKKGPAPRKKRGS